MMKNKQKNTENKMADSRERVADKELQRHEKIQVLKMKNKPKKDKK